jgi:uncharacterized protein YjbI with pentapeptide repeats
MCFPSKSIDHKHHFCWFFKYKTPHFPFRSRIGSTKIRVSSFACFFSFAKHETKRNSSLVSRNFACFAKQHILRNFVSFRFVKSKISFRFAKFHLVSFCFANFHLVSFRFAKFHRVLYRFADIQTVSFHTVLRSRIIFMWLRLRVKILMRFQLLPYYIAGQNLFKGVTGNIRSDILFSSDSL